jgi:hypothetical protein
MPSSSYDFLLLAKSKLTPAQAIQLQSLEDFPKSAVKWMGKLDWEWPRAVDLSEIDFSNKKEWTASPDDKKVEKFQKKLTKGLIKPAILVRPKGASKYIVVDGHHRALACKGLDRPLMAWTAEAPSKQGEWDTMHDLQDRLSATMTDLDIVLAADSMAKASTPEPFSKNPLWHKKPLHLPFYVQHVAHKLLAQGHSESEAIAMAIAIIKKWAQKKPSGGEKSVHSDTQAAAAKAVAEWNADKQAVHGGK